ncbi:DUF1460 domain-containing protein [Xanthomonas arboricola]|uniref:DUF1460 domain-containing protein n=1 Tax=Xanthomonas arboricola TaxID=56448 RepID=UPI001FD6F34D|nr:DUF1460 domain-containing protein [Xanthomonas arboricola]UOS99679.1 DUF1460 domain-containing protein [Xanthomonas arboricola]
MSSEARWLLVTLLAITCATGCCARAESAPEASTARVQMDAYTANKLNTVLEETSRHRGLSTGHMIDLVSAQFLETPYRANVLQGSATVPEKLIVDFTGLDCFTYLDYVEAARKSHSQQDFVNNLVFTRYVDGVVSFTHRKHFFTDWANRPYELATDITTRISTDTVTVMKQLNLKADGSNYLPGLPVVDRAVTYIPTEHIDGSVIRKLRTGDFIGIYTHLAGLDVTHVGFFIMTDTGPVLRNASSRKENEKVVDSPFMEYVARTPGIIVYRAKE